MRLTRKGGAVVLASSLLLAGGCGSDTTDVADSVAGAEGSGESTAQPDGDGPLVDRLTQDELYQRYGDWLRSDYVQKLRPESLPTEQADESRVGGIPTFEYATDKSDLIVSGVVKDLRFVPEGTLTTFKVDRTAKGGKKDTIYFMQPSHIRPKNYEFDKTDNAILIVDPVQPILFKGDRAALFLRDTGAGLDPVQLKFLGDSLGKNVTIYIVTGSAGQYRVKDDKVKPEKDAPGIRERDRRFDGKSEDEVLDAAEARLED